MAGEQGSSFGSAAVVYGENARKPSARRASVRSPVIVKSRQRDSRWRRKLRAGRRVFKTVGRRHPALRWVPTRSPLGCDTNKPGGHRSRYPRSSLCPPAAGVSFASVGPVWPGLAWVHLGRRRLVCLARGPERENNNTKSRPHSDDQNTHKANVSPTLSFCNAAPLALHPHPSLGQK